MTLAIIPDGMPAPYDDYGRQRVPANNYDFDNLFTEYLIELCDSVWFVIWNRRKLNKQKLFMYLEFLNEAQHIVIKMKLPPNQLEVLETLWAMDARDAYNYWCVDLVAPKIAGDKLKEPL